MLETVQQSFLAAQDLFLTVKMHAKILTTLSLSNL